ncbi:expressed unknown protein [Seminavis robusta]|uniref:Uncharacterized protein n=1 Tax=Seminavis robusta TaxID=568900 RepID=A0A9N8EGG8_9STRA|nr:expressed unknown protein [Seminavis robusta]|eukprot:Sro1060_g236660.1 n/a (427) ;mRNA; r:10086-11366
MQHTTIAHGFDSIHPESQNKPTSTSHKTEIIIAKTSITNKQSIRQSRANHASHSHLFQWQHHITNSSNEETLRTPLLPTENFENTLPDGILTINAFEIAEGGYDEFVATILNRLVEICQANPWLLGRLEQTRTISLTSPLNGDFEIVTPVNLDRSALQARIQKDVFVESPSDLDWWNTLDGSPLADLMNFVAAKGPTANSTTGLHPNLPGRTYHDLSKLLKSHPDTGIPTGPESAKAQSSLFRVVILPTPTRRHAFLIMGMSHTVADGNTYHRILHMLLGSTNRKTRQPVEIVPLAYDMRASSLELQQEVDLQTLVKNYKRERDAVVPEAKLMDQIKLGLDIGRSAMKEQFYEGRQLQSFVTLVNLQEINRLKEEYAAPQFQDAVFAEDSERPPKSQTLSTNDILVCELSKLLNIDRVDTLEYRSS